MTVRRRTVLALPVAVACGGACAATLPAPRSLPDELDRALAMRRPLVVMASLHGCPFCRQVRDSFLAPLRAQTGQPVVQLDLGSRATVVGFDGRGTTHDQQLRDWKVAVAPAVLFFGRGGREVAERLVGASIPDFYGHYLDERLRAASRSV